MNVTILQLQKRASYTYDNIQDKFAINTANKTYALSDGTTQSFRSEKWAALITKSFVDAPIFGYDKIITTFSDCAYQFQNEKIGFSSNYAIAALEKAKMAKGASATFLGVQFSNKNIDVISCGDTNLFIIDNDTINGFPYATIEGLNTNNKFINTVQLAEKQTDDSFFQKRSFPISTAAAYILATDALSRLFLKNNEAIQEIRVVKNFHMLHDFCIKYWEKKELEEDDISAIIINTDNTNTITEIIPPADFSFPKEEEQEFIPTTNSNDNSENLFTEMQIQEIQNQFNGVAKDFRQVKNKQQKIWLLVIATTVLAFLNLIFFTLSIGKKDSQENNQNQQMQLQQINNNQNTIDEQKDEINSLKNEIEQKNVIIDSFRNSINPKVDAEQNKPIQKTDNSNKHK